MALTHEGFRRALMFVEKNCDGFTDQFINRPSTSDEFEEFKTKAYHFKVLIEAGFIDGKVTEVVDMEQVVPEFIRCRGLTMSGQQVLEAMANPDIWSKIKAGVTEAGVDGIKKIPTLAIDMLLRMAAG